MALPDRGSLFCRNTKSPTAERPSRWSVLSVCDLASGLAACARPARACLFWGGRTDRCSLTVGWLAVLQKYQQSDHCKASKRAANKVVFAAFDSAGQLGAARPARHVLFWGGRAHRGSLCRELYVRHTESQLRGKHTESPLRGKLQARLPTRLVLAACDLSGASRVQHGQRPQLFFFF